MLLLPSIFYKRASVVLGIVLLPVSLLAALDYSPYVDQWQTMFWFYNYDHGFVQRGLRGAIIGLFYEDLTIETIQPLILRSEKIIIIASILMLWAVLVPKIWTHNFSDKNKLMFTAFAAVLLFVPAWKMFGFIAGFGDEWAFFFAMLSFICFLGKQPFFYVFFMVMGYLCHTQGVIYLCMLNVLIVHSVLRNPAYTKHWRKWIIAAIMPVGVIVSLYLIDQKEALLAIYNQYGSEWRRFLPERDISIVFRMGTQEKTGGDFYSHIIKEGLALNYIKHFATYGAYTLIYTMLFSYACVHAGVYCKTKFLAINWPMLARLIPYECFIISAMLAFGTIPFVVVGGDGERFLHVSFLMAAIIVAYFLWFFDDVCNDQEAPTAKSGKNREEKKGKKKAIFDRGIPKAANSENADGRFITPITVFMIIWAYTFAGAPLIVFGKMIETCNLCHNETNFLNKNPLGKWFSLTMYDINAHKNVHFFYDNKWIHGFLQTFTAHQEGYRFEDNKLLISGDLKNKLLFERYFIVKSGQIVTAKLNYRGAADPPATFSYYDNFIPSAYADDNKIIWKFKEPEGRHTGLYRFHSVSEQDYEVISFSISIVDE